MDYLLVIWNAFGSLMKTFSLTDALDVIVVSFLVYGFIRLIRETRAEQLVKGLMILMGAWVLSYQLNFRMLSTILNNFFQISVLALLVVFQPELRRALEHIGRSKLGDYWSLNHVMGEEDEEEQRCKNIIKTISDTAGIFQGSGVGALMVFERKTKLGDIIDTGTVLKAEASVELIANIFFNKAPLHDGAVVIRDNLVYAAGCILPLTKDENISPELGTRHRAAIGISEDSDAVVVIVSEETGVISVAVNGVITRDYNHDTLQAELEALLIQNPREVPYKNIITSFRRGKRNEKDQ